jgi:hypothetical protein
VILEAVWEQTCIRTTVVSGPYRRARNVAWRA